MVMVNGSTVLITSELQELQLQVSTGKINSKQLNDER